MGQRWPESWLNVEKDVKQLASPPARAGGLSKKLASQEAKAPMHHISYAQFSEVCNGYGVTTESGKRLLAETLHNLGIILHYDDPLLRELVVLLPNWITKAISYALRDETTAQLAGILAHAELPRIWKQYDSRLYAAFWSLMNKFELCYQLDSDKERSLIPALLPFSPPPIPEIVPVLQMLYRLSSIPAGIISRFIVRTHRFGTNRHWREGVFLEFDGQRAVVELFVHKRELRIQVEGTSPTHFFAVLTDTMDQILACFPGLSVDRWVPCICHQSRTQAERCTYEFRYRDLVVRKQKGRRTIECNETLEEVSLIACCSGYMNQSAPRIVAGKVAQFLFAIDTSDCSEGKAHGTASAAFAAEVSIRPSDCSEGKECVPQRCE